MKRLALKELARLCRIAAALAGGSFVLTGQARAQSVVIAPTQSLPGAPRSAGHLSPDFAACKANLGPDSSYALDRRTRQLWLFDHQWRRAANLSAWAIQKHETVSPRAVEETLIESNHVQAKFKARLEQYGQPFDVPLGLPDSSTIHTTRTPGSPVLSDFAALRRALNNVAAAAGSSRSRRAAGLFLACGYDFDGVSFSVAGRSGGRLEFRPRTDPPPDWRRYTVVSLDALLGGLGPAGVQGGRP